MLRNNRSSKLFLRILCGALALFMILGALASFTYLFSSHVHAADYPENMRVHVGLKYGSSMDEAYTMSSSSGFSVVSQNISDRTMPETVLFKLSDTQLIAAAAKNLVKTGNTYYGTSSTAADIGGYSLQSNRQFTSYESAKQYITKNYASKLSEYNVYVAYDAVSSRFRIRIGDYTSADSASAAATAVRSKIGDSITVIEPNTSVYLIDSEEGTVIFAYNGGTNSAGDELYLGLQPQSSDNGIYVSGAGYAGSLVYKCAQYGGNTKLQLSNVLELETYLVGVMHREISASWPLEARKAFAITARTYTIANLNRHPSYDFDLCASTHCHAYTGTFSIQDAYRKKYEEAIDATKGMVISYEGEIASIYYSSSTGGVTVSAADAYGESAASPYLIAIQTPWEKYLDHASSHSVWHVEVTPENLAAALRSHGYTQIKDAVAEIRILQFAENSTYVYSLEIVDIYGNSIVLTKTETVRLALGRYSSGGTTLFEGVYSANFVVGKGSVRYTTEVDTTIVENPEASLDAEPKFTVKTAWETLVSRFKKGLSVITSNGYDTLPEEAVSIITSENVLEYTGTTTDTNTDTEYEILYASDENNFVFYGKGYGHGVGLSQWGLYDMGRSGYTYDQMLAAYFPTTELTHYTDLK
ncbi:MAG: SpoIID/LytB domain-containing protein [Clostridia bacterium]|nr:SpoIID/LytB domain-containing protein [Clostridia bacterium]